MLNITGVGMKRRGVIIVTMILLVSSVVMSLAYLFTYQASEEAPAWVDATRLKLPEPRFESDVSVEEAPLKRRSIREYNGGYLTLQEVSQLLWAAQGVTDLRGLRIAPSAGALYPLEVYLVVGDVQGLAPEVYKYLPDGHEITRVLDGDKRAQLADAVLGQAWVREASADIVIAAV
jgi:hypothetical protein